MKTAFSKKYEREIDAVQLLSLLGHDIKNDPTLETIQAPDRSFIEKDILCPSCGVSGALIVSGARSKKNNKSIRQPHFRFVLPNGKNKHDQYCEFAETQVLNNSNHVQIDFSKSNSEFTRYIGNLVCKGIENDLISQMDIRNLRQWHYDTKKNSVIDIKITEKECLVFQEIKKFKRRVSFDFRPEYAELKELNWINVASDELAKKHKKFVEGISNEVYLFYNTFSEREYRAILKKIEKHTFDIRCFSTQYLLIQKFRNFLILYDLGCPKIKSSKNSDYYFDAFCSLLLFKSSWNIDKAISLYIKIKNCDLPVNANLGNIIGTAPFVDFKIMKNILDANDYAEYLIPLDSMKIQMNKVYQFLKNQYCN
jgi:hypothetical protein